MKLASVTLLSPIPYRGGATTEFSAIHDSLEYDRAADVVIIGDGGLEVPRERVAHWVRDRKKEPPVVKPACDICGKVFNNGQAKGGHMRQKHGVSSTRRVA